MKRPMVHSNSVLTPSMGWLTIFNDMVTLLMVFFVLLFSMGSMDEQRFARFQNALQSAMGVLHEGRHAPEGLISDQPKSIDAGVRGPGAVEPGSEPIGMPATEGLEAEYTRRGLELRLSEELLFSSGSAELTEAGFELLARVGAVVRTLNRRIRVEGHTDDRPIATARYPSNWELSTDRAVRVVKFFIAESHIPDAHLAAAGYGASRPRASNDTAAGRATNRRVEIIVGPSVSVGPDDQR